MIFFIKVKYAPNNSYYKVSRFNRAQYDFFRVFTEKTRKPKATM